jgi:PAS domain S-box-containing protein
VSDDLGGDPPCWAHLVDQPLAVDDALLAALVDQLADAVIVAGPNGSIVYWNQAAERLFGWSATQAVGQTLDLIIPERQRGAHWDGYRQVMRTAHTRYGEELLRVPALHADGQRRSIAFTVTLLTDATGAVTAIAAVVRDETRRWADEQALRNQLREATETGGVASPAESGGVGGG